MKIKLLLSLLLMVPALSVGQSLKADLEDLSLPPDTFWNGSDMSGKFNSGNFIFYNDYDTAFGGIWSGFSYSTMTDSTTPGFSNQYSARPGAGVAGSMTYAVGTTYGPAGIKFPDCTNSQPGGFFITNTTYAARSMETGDAFAKKFGGSSGDDPDWFRVVINVFGQQSLTDTMHFYLADYRFQDNDSDYIVTDWRWVDLSEFPGTDSLSFVLESSDTGQFGMNTPAYFALDDLSSVCGIGYTESFHSVNYPYPNPAKDNLFLNEKRAYIITDLNGRIILSGNDKVIDVSRLVPGIYFLRFPEEVFNTGFKFLKQ